MFIVPRLQERTYASGERKTFRSPEAHYERNILNYKHVAPLVRSRRRFYNENLLSRRQLSAALSAAGGKALAAQNGATGLGLEWNTVTLAALIANNLETFPFAATAASSALPGAAKILTARVATWLAALRMSQSPFAIIVLLSFSKRKA